MNKILRIVFRDIAVYLVNGNICEMPWGIFYKTSANHIHVMYKGQIQSQF